MTSEWLYFRKYVHAITLGVLGSKVKVKTKIVCKRLLPNFASHINQI